VNCSVFIPFIPLTLGLQREKCRGNYYVSKAKNNEISKSISYFVGMKRYGILKMLYKAENMWP